MRYILMLLPLTKQLVFWRDPNWVIWRDPTNKH